VRTRHVQPEILDSLPADDPAAIRSRKDLRWINSIMRNFDWVDCCLRDAKYSGPIDEIGAGEGRLLKHLEAEGFTVNGIDLAPRPDGLAEHIGWRQGDVFDGLESSDGVVVATLFLHHFEKDQLRRLGRLFANRELLIFVEPWRSWLALFQGYALLPFVSAVTRHDMIKSIRAGFRPGELPHLLGLDEGWTIREQATVFGTCRMLATRK